MSLYRSQVLPPWVVQIGEVGEGKADTNRVVYV